MYRLFNLCYFGKFEITRHGFTMTGNSFEFRNISTF